MKTCWLLTTTEPLNNVERTQNCWN